MNEYICKIATKEEIIKKYDSEIHKNNDNNEYTAKLEIRKKEVIKWVKEKKAIIYIVVLNNEIIAKAMALLDRSIVQNPGDRINDDEIVNRKTAYITSLKVEKKFEKLGVLTKLFNFIENDLKQKGYTRLTIGTEPINVKKIKMFFGWGVDNFLKTAYEEYPSKSNFGELDRIIVNYYYKDII